MNIVSEYLKKKLKISWFDLKPEMQLNSHQVNSQQMRMSSKAPKRTHRFFSIQLDWGMWIYDPQTVLRIGMSKTCSSIELGILGTKPNDVEV